MDPTSQIQQILEKFKSNEIDDQSTWDSVELILKASHDTLPSVQVENLLDDVLLLLLQKWSKVSLINQNNLISASIFPTFLHCTKLWNEIESLKISGLFTQIEIAELMRRILKIKESFLLIKIHGSELYLKKGLETCKRKMEACEQTIKELKLEYESISPALLPIHTRLVEVKRELEQLLGRKNPHAFSLVEVQVIQEELREIDSVRIDGKFLTKDQQVVPGQGAVIDLLEQCFDDIHELLASKDPVDSENPLRNVYEDLIKIKAQLERFSIYSRWSLKSDDFIPFQVRLGEIDNMRSDGKFLAEDGSVPPGQAVLHFLLHKCYRLIYKLQIACEPVAESLMSVYNQLLTLQKCLLQLKKWNVSLSSTELIPYQMKLDSIRKLQRDGKFHNEQGQVPEGQAILFSLLEQCHDIVRELQLDCSE